jgi:hypothetical protein
MWAQTRLPQKLDDRRKDINKGSRIIHRQKCYTHLFHGFGQAKCAYSGSILGSSQFTLLPQLPQKNNVQFKSGKNWLKIIMSLHKSKAMTNSVENFIVTAKPMNIRNAKKRFTSTSNKSIKI